MSSAPAPELAALREDAWLTTLLGRPAWRLDPGVANIAAVAALAKLTGPYFCDARIDCAQIERVNALEDAGMHVVSTSLTLVRSAGGSVSAPASIAVRDAEPSADGRVGEIAERCFRLSRFHLDPEFPDDVANRSKREWAENGLHGRRGDRMLVAVDDGSVVGFCLLAGSVIDLIGVDTDAQGRGVGTALVAAVIDFLGDAPVSVGTQVANQGATRFYERLGFELESSAYDLHLHRES